jgi:RNase adaptor protein for sRNA GlmZ degradation
LHAKVTPNIARLLDSVPPDVKIIFLDAKDHILVRRYKETRREHPLAKPGEQLEKAEDRVVLEGRRRELVSGRYAQAAASETEWLDAEDDLAMAEIERATATTRLRLTETERIITPSAGGPEL